MKTLRKIIPAFILGVGIGSLVECLFSLIYGQVFIGTPAFMAFRPSLVFIKIIQTLLHRGFGLVSLLEEQFSPGENSKSLFKATAIHFLLIFAYFIFTGFYLHWFPNTPNIFTSPGILTLIYFIIWILIYLTGKRKTEEMDRVSERNRNHLIDEQDFPIGKKPSLGMAFLCS